MAEPTDTKTARPQDLRLSLRTTVERMKAGEVCRTRFKGMTPSDIATVKPWLETKNNAELDKWIRAFLLLTAASEPSSSTAAAAAAAAARSPSRPPPAARKRKWHTSDSDELTVEVICADCDTRIIRAAADSTIQSTIRFLMHGANLTADDVILLSLSNGEVLVDTAVDAKLLHPTKLLRSLGIWANASNRVRLFFGSRRAFTQTQSVEITEPIDRVWICVHHGGETRLIGIHERLSFDRLHTVIQSSFGLPASSVLTLTLENGTVVPKGISRLGLGDWMTETAELVDDSVIVLTSTTKPTAASAAAAAVSNTA